MDDDVNVFLADVFLVFRINALTLTGEWLYFCEDSTEGRTIVTHGATVRSPPGCAVAERRTPSALARIRADSGA
jgi:hypothetical protein